MVVRAKIVVFSTFFGIENKLLSFSEFMNFLLRSLNSSFVFKAGPKIADKIKVKTTFIS